MRTLGVLDAISNDAGPVGPALLALEAIQAAPGITGARLAARLGVTDRAARRYVATLPEAGIPVESASGPYGGYRIGRGARDRARQDPRVLPPATAAPIDAMRRVQAKNPSDVAATPDAELTATITQACQNRKRILIRAQGRLQYCGVEVTAADLLEDQISAS